jgi:hypothetical protein
LSVWPSCTSVAMASAIPSTSAALAASCVILDRLRTVPCC